MPNDQPLTVDVEQPKPKVNLFLLVVTLVSLATVFILFSKSCNKDVQYANAQKTLNDTLDAKEARSHDTIVAKTIALDSVIRIAHAERSARQSDHDSASKAITALQKENKGLPGRILQYVLVPGDTAGMALQRRRCDSAAVALAKGSEDVDRLRLADSLMQALYQYEIKIREDFENDQAKALDSCWAWGHTRSGIINNLQPHGKLIGGVSAQYSQAYGQAGIWLMYYSRGGKAYGIGSGYNSLNKPYFEGRVGIVIFGR